MTDVIAPRYKRARTLPELVRAHISVLGVPDRPKGEAELYFYESLVSTLAGAAVALPAVLLLYSPIELVAAPQSLLATAWVLAVTLVVLKLIAFPVSDRVAGVTRIRGVESA